MTPVKFPFSHKVLLKTFEKGDLKKLAELKHKLSKLIVNHDGTMHASYLSKKGLFVCLDDGSVEYTKTILEEAKVVYAFSMVGRIRDFETSAVIEEDALITFAARGGTDRTYHIIEPFTNKDGEIGFGRKVAGYRSRSQKREAFAEILYSIEKRRVGKYVI